MSASPPAVALADRLCRPQRVGVFGHRGVGKTTLLTMLYREAVGGRLPGLRLAAGDAATARHLADKVLQLEAGDVLPATLAETDLRFQLYHQGARIELLVRDYQGEHVELGRREPVRDFLRDCDAVWLCFDPALLLSPERCLRGQQEAEQLVEDYLALGPPGGLHRPMAVVLTKADLLPPRPDGTPEDEWPTGLAQSHFAMTVYSLKEHSPGNAVLAVSSLGPRPGSEPPESADVITGVLQPQHLDSPLVWLAEALQAQDEARIERLFTEGDIDGLRRAVACFAKRYPQAAKAAAYQRRLREVVWRRRRRRGLVGAAVAAFLALALWGYDSLAYHSARRFDESTDDPAAALQRWHRYAALPLSISRRDAARSRLAELNEEVERREFERAFADLRRRAADASTDPRSALGQFHAFHARYPDAPGLAEVRSQIEARLHPLLRREAQRAYDELLKAEQRLLRTGPSSTDRERDAARQRLEELAARAGGLMKEFSDPELASKLRERRNAYLRRLDEHAFESARDYGRREPLHFQTRRERFQAYLDRHPGGAFEKEARAAVAAVEAEWDRHDFRTVRDHFVEKPARLKELTARCERYLLVHPQGRYAGSARELMRWAERAGQEREYTVVAQRGEFSGNLGRWYTRGPDLAVEIEVNGVPHGPSGIAKNDYNPQWEYEFPRPVRWKLGDRVRVRVIDHDFFNRVVVDITSADDDLLAMRMLSGKLEAGEHTLWFSSDFNMPRLPRIE